MQPHRATTAQGVWPQAAETGAYTLTINPLAGAFDVPVQTSTGPGGSYFSFEWSLPLQDVGLTYPEHPLGPIASKFRYGLPSFSIAANPGRALSGPVTLEMGNVTFAEFAGNSPVPITVGARLLAGVSVDRDQTVGLDLPFERITSGVSTAGYLQFSVDAATGGAFSEFEFGKPTTTSCPNVVNVAPSIAFATQGGDQTSVARVVIQPQNLFRVSFHATALAVPEPGSAGLMVAGLAGLGGLIRRRPV